MGAEDPVLLVCSYPQAGEAWWMHVQDWFSDPAHRASGRIDFDKGTQRFDAGAAQRLLNLAGPHGRAHVPTAEHHEETLTSNLLSVAILDMVYRTPTQIQDPREIYERQREAGDDAVRHDFVREGGQLYTWLPPQDTGLASAVSGTPVKVRTAHLAASWKAPEQRLLVSCSTSRSAKTSPPTATGTTGAISLLPRHRRPRSQGHGKVVNSGAVTSPVRVVWSVRRCTR
jgi:hypothetical protein